MTTTTVYLDDDEPGIATGEVEFGDAATHDRWSDEPPSYDRVRFLTVTRDGADVTGALSKRERAKCEEALIEAAREEGEGPDPEDRDDVDYFEGRGW